MSLLWCKALTTKEREVLILLHSYASDDGRGSMTVRQLHDAVEEVQQWDRDDWTWHDYSMTTLGSHLRILEARTLVASDGRNPAKWNVTETGLRYVDAGGNKAKQRQILQQGFEAYLGRLDASHDHSKTRRLT